MALHVDDYDSGRSLLFVVDDLRREVARLTRDRDRLTSELQVAREEKALADGEWRVVSDERDRLRALLAKHGISDDEDAE